MADDGVSTALELIVEEIAKVWQQLQTENQTAFQQRRFADADRSIATARQLDQFGRELEQLKSKWKESVEPAIRDRVGFGLPTTAPPRVPLSGATTQDPVVSGTGYTIPVHKKGGRTRLRVGLPGGRVIQRTTAADTFADTIDALGAERVQALDLTINKLPLVSTEPSDKYNQAKRGRYFIVTHSNTPTKKKLLDEIAERLHVRLSVQIV